MIVNMLLFVHNCACLMSQHISRMSADFLHATSFKFSHKDEPLNFPHVLHVINYIILCVQYN